MGTHAAVDESCNSPRLERTRKQIIGRVFFPVRKWGLASEESSGKSPRRILQDKSKNGRYIFVTVRTPAVKYAIELCEVLEKTDKTTCPCLFRDPERLLSSQWIWGEGHFF